jgi:hypothetical protein
MSPVLNRRRCEYSLVWLPPVPRWLPRTLQYDPVPGNEALPGRGGPAADVVVIESHGLLRARLKASLAPTADLSSCLRVHPVPE